MWQPNDPTTHGNPSGQACVQDEHGRTIEITWWQHRHPNEARGLPLSVIRVVRPQATDRERDPRTSGLVWMGDPHADQAQEESRSPTVQTLSACSIISRPTPAR